MFKVIDAIEILKGGFKVNLSFTTPSSDRTITFPANTGKVLLDTTLFDSNLVTSRKTIFNPNTKSIGSNASYVIVPTGTHLSLTSSIDIELSSTSYIQAGSDGQMVILYNHGSNKITLPNTTSIITKGDLLLEPDDYAVFHYRNAAWTLTSTSGKGVWEVIALPSGWYQVTDAETPGYMIEPITGLIRFKGYIGNNNSHTIFGTVIFTIPSDIRPSKNLVFPTGDIMCGFWYILPNGQVIYYCNNTTIPNGITQSSLNTIQYYV